MSLEPTVLLRYSLGPIGEGAKAGISFLLIHVIIGFAGDNMIRTQISLDEHEYKLAKQEAASLGISVAEFVRRAVREMLPISGTAAWMRFAGFVESGDSHSSQSIDDFVYGAKD